MIVVHRFAGTDLAELALQPAQAGEAALDTIGTPDQIEGAGPAFTVRAADGRVLMCGGLIEVHPHYATAWARLAIAKGGDMVALTRATARVVAEARYARIDMAVRADFKAGHAWARLLGFVPEGTLRRYGADGADYRVYARIRENG